MGKHIFGTEPSNSELLLFYIYEFDKIDKIKVSETEMETKNMGFKKSLSKSKKTQIKIGIGKKSQNLFQKAFEKLMEIKKKEHRVKKNMDKEEKYRKKQEKKLAKKKGH